MFDSALIVGKDYPHPDGLDYVRRKWKEGIRDPTNCQLIEGTSPDILKENERIIRKAVGRGRYVSGWDKSWLRFAIYMTMVMHIFI